MSADQRETVHRAAARCCERPVSTAAPESACTHGSPSPRREMTCERPGIVAAEPRAVLSCRLRVFALRALRSESGLSLMELVVGLTIMTIFMTMFTGAAVMMYNASSKTEALSDTASQLSIAFNRLDKSVRYASAISTPGQSGDDWYVEWLSTYTGSKQCTQVRVHAADGQLQQRTWSVAADGTASGLSSWVPLASGLDIDTAEQPFTLNVGSDATRNAVMPYQQLTFQLTAEATGRTGITTTATDVTFTAFNSGVLTTGSVCQEGGRS